MAKNQAPVGAPPWMVTFADLMSLLVCFFVLIISFSVPDTLKLKIVAGSMRDAFGFQREMIVTGMVEIDGNPRYEYPQELVPVPVKDRVGPIPAEDDDIRELSAREDAWERVIELIDSYLVRPRVVQEQAQINDAGTEQERFANLERDLRQAMQSVPELQRLAENLQIEHAPEGLRIQIVDRPAPRCSRSAARPCTPRPRRCSSRSRARSPGCPIRYRSPGTPTASRSAPPTITTTGPCPWTGPTPRAGSSSPADSIRRASPW
jgi:chemotaxis protein MotB